MWRGDRQTGRLIRLPSICQQHRPGDRCRPCGTRRVAPQLCTPRASAHTPARLSPVHAPLLTNHSAHTLSSVRSPATHGLTARRQSLRAPLVPRAGAWYRDRPGLCLPAHPFSYPAQPPTCLPACLPARPCVCLPVIAFLCCGLDRRDSTRSSGSRCRRAPSPRRGAPPTARPTRLT